MKTILVADDDEAIRTLLQAALSGCADCTVITVPDGYALLDMLDTVRPQLILLDVNMPGIDGLEVYRRIRTREDMARVPILFVSATCHPCDDSLDGSVRWLTKPFRMARLLDAVATLLAPAQAASRE